MYRMARERVRWPAVVDRARESSAAPWPPFWTAGTRRADLADQATDEQISAVRRARATRVRRLKKDLEASQRERYADVTQPEAPSGSARCPRTLMGVVVSHWVGVICFHCCGACCSGWLVLMVSSGW
ncbi:hypothetical protein ACH4TQ_49840 [Streptomyces sp. NPDC021218]|uniref:hypothetical protein n=1 Tax=unclassified Streptomyces TaxID=2593676 RepID=UPI0036AEFCB8